MNSMLKKITFVILGLFFIHGFCVAQDGKDMRGNEIFEVLKKNLTSEQKDMLQKNRKENDQMRDAFKATLTAEQKAILENKEIEGKEKRDAFRASLSDNQLGMLESQKASRKAQMEAFRTTLTDEQKEKLKKFMDKRHPNFGKGFPKKDDSK